LKKRGISIFLLLSLSRLIGGGGLKKKRNFHLPSPLSVKVDWRGREMMNSSGLECEVCCSL